MALLDLNGTRSRRVRRPSPASTAWTCNVADAASVEAAVAAVATEMGGIDILVNSAGIVDLAPAEELSLAAWQRTLDINLTGSFLMAQAVGRRMIAAGPATDRQSRLAGRLGRDRGHVAYCASKFGVIGLTRTLAIEWGRHGITVNSISPTVVLTDSARRPGPVRKATR